MKRKRKIFIFVGLVILITLLALRFGLLDKLKENKRAVETTLEKITPKFEAKTITQEERKVIDNSKKIEVVEAEVIIEEPKKANVTTSPIKEDVIATIIPATTNEKKITPKEEIVIKEEVNPHAHIGGGNPFNYSSSSVEDYSPLSANRAVGLISIKGIICMAGEAPRAILHLNDTNKSYYVEKGDVIRIHTPTKTGALITESYISVKDIRPDEVELVQQERPDRVIIVR